MSRSIRNISIHFFVVAALAVFAILIGAVALLSFQSDRNAELIMGDLDRINVQQLNEINRADALLNVARVSLETASNELMLGRMAAVNEHLDTALNRVDRAEAHLNSFIAAPKSEQAQEVAHRIEQSFTTVLDIVRQQHEALDQLDTTRFGKIGRAHV